MDTTLLQPVTSHQSPVTSDQIYLTFDDGPDPEWTPKVLAILADAQARATFFAIGTCARRFPTLVRQAAAEGHEVGNHTLDHKHPWTMTTAEARRQVRDGAAVLSDILGRAPRFFRPPHGRSRPCMTQEAQRCGETVVQWDLSAIDWGVLGTASRIADRLQRIKPGDVVLMHDGRNRHNRPEELLSVLPGILDELRRRNLRAVTLGSMD